ncbi:FadR/GntR family transcriptional regulator [Azospirillum sp. ST 5-10]|uniref:FadR/GntR family transcriptional regulator n=1 Tax=unclassified Azospirillum TaxID=2630922 RepID=UPI003F49D2BD
MQSGRLVKLRPSGADLPKLEPVSDPERVDLIAAAVREIVAAGAALPPERVLAEGLRVKRHRLRSALELLRKEGHIGQPVVGRPRNAAAPDAGETLIICTNPIEVIEMRMVVEPGLARLAALRASPFEIAQIEAAATTGAGAETGAVDLAFHMAVAAGARNNLGVELYGLLRRVGTDARVRIGAKDAAVCPKRIQQRDAEHRAIAAAIAARDLDGAEQAMRAHLLAVQKRITERLMPGVTAA